MSKRKRFKCESCEYESFEDEVENCERCQSPFCPKCTIECDGCNTFICVRCHDDICDHVSVSNPYYYECGNCLSDSQHEVVRRWCDSCVSEEDFYSAKVCDAHEEPVCIGDVVLGFPDDCNIATCKFETKVEDRFMLLSCPRCNRVLGWSDAEKAPQRNLIN